MLCFLLATLGACSSMSMAISPGQVTAALREADSRLSHGTIKASVHTDQYPPFDPKSYKESLTLVYASDGRYRMTLTGTPETARDRIYDGKSYSDICFPPGKKDRYLYLQPGATLNAHDKISTIVPGPCYALGRNLSTLKDSKVTIDGSGVRVSGKGYGGDIIEAMLDPAHGYVATVINRRFADSGALVGTWQLGVPKQFGGSPYIATQATWKSGKLPTVMLQRQYAISNAVFAEPDSNIFSFAWKAKDLNVIDMRVGSHAPCYYPAKSVQRLDSLDQMLQNSHKVTDDRRKNQEKYEAEKRTQAQQKQFRYRLIQVIAVISTVLLILFLVIRIRKRNIATKD